MAIAVEAIESKGEFEVLMAKHQFTPAGVEALKSYVFPALGENPEYPTLGPFGPYYESLGGSERNLERKYLIARVLIEAGFQNPRFLVRKFIPAGQPETAEAQTFKDELQLLLIKNGEIPDVESADEREAQDVFLRAVQQDEQLRNLAGILPIPVLEVATRVKLWGNIGNEEKLRKIRSFAMGALLREELGVIAVQIPLGEIELRDIVLQCPEQIFSETHYVTSNIVRHYFTKQALRLYVNGEEEGFRKLHELVVAESLPAKRAFFAQIEQEFQQYRDVPIPPVFVDSVKVWDTLSPMPLFMHKYLIGRFLQSRRKMWNGGTGATKTAAFYQAAAAVGAEKVIIFGPAKARNTWPGQAREIFKVQSQPKIGFRFDAKLGGYIPDVFTIRKYRDLDNPRIETAPVVFIGAELLGKAWGNHELHQKVKAAINRRKVDMVGFDESHEFRNEEAGRCLMLMELMGDIRANYLKDHLLELPAIALTATPISTGLENLDITMALLYPERFALPGRYQQGRTTFSIQALRDPMIAFSLLYGEQYMEQWDLYDLFGGKVPKPEYERIPIKMSPYQRVIYEWIRALPINPLDKMRLLRNVLLNPELIKRNIEERLSLPAVVPINVLTEQLQQLHFQWSEWMQKKDNRISSEPFSADWIAKYGGGEFLLQCFFHPELVSGVNTLAERMPNVTPDWNRPKTISPKYEFLMNFLKKRVSQGENGRVVDGFIPNERVFITVPYHRRGVTRWIDNPKLKPKELDDNAWSLYEYMMTEWLPGLPSNMAITIDGSRTFNARDRIALLWRESGNEYFFIVATMDTINESMNWAVRDTRDNGNITIVNAISTHYPLTAEELDQWAGRFIRPGLGRAVRHLILETQESFDTNNYDLVRLRSLITQMTLAAVPIREQDREFYRTSTTAKRIIMAEPNVGQTFLQDVVRRLKGRGEQEVGTELSKTKNGRSLFDLFAEFYFDEGRDEFRITGNNNEMVKNIILRYKPRRVLSVGAGSCLLARKLRQAGFTGEIDNIDINPAILRIAKERFPQIGAITVEGASALSVPAEYYDVAEYGFVIPWTKQYDPKEQLPIHETERVKTHLQMNRALKLGGIAELSFPESAFDEETFANYARTLTGHFGFRIIEPSGISYATDLNPPRRIGWVITAQKIAEPNLSGLDPALLTLLSDERTRISRPKRRKDVKPTVVTVEYPIFSSNEFEITNPLTQEVSTIVPPEIDDDSFESPRDLVYKIKDSLSAAQRDVWNALRRDLETGTDRKYEDAEEVLAGIIRKRGADRLPEWNSGIIRRMLADVTRFIRRNRGNGVS